MVVLDHRVVAPTVITAGKFYGRRLVYAARHHFRDVGLPRRRESAGCVDADGKFRSGEGAHDICKCLSAIRADASGMEVNDVPVIELQVHPAAGRKAGFFAGRDSEELRWMATELRRALNVPAERN